MDSQLDVACHVSMNLFGNADKKKIQEIITEREQIDLKHKKRRDQVAQSIHENLFDTNSVCKKNSINEIAIPLLKQEWV